MSCCTLFTIAGTAMLSSTRCTDDRIDMAGDAIAVLDELRVDRAHGLGLSLGVHRQEVAIAYPERDRSLTLTSTSADATDTSMPGPRTWPLIRSAIGGLPLLRYRLLGGETNLVKEMLAGLVAQTGDEPVDVEEWTRIVLYDWWKGGERGSRRD